MRSEILQLRTAHSNADDTATVAAAAVVAAADSSMVTTQPSCNGGAIDSDRGASIERTCPHPQLLDDPFTNKADDAGSEHDGPAESEEEEEGCSGGEDDPFDKPMIVDVSDDAATVLTGHSY